MDQAMEREHEGQAPIEGPAKPQGNRPFNDQRESFDLTYIPDNDNRNLISNPDRGIEPDLTDAVPSIRIKEVTAEIPERSQSPNMEGTGSMPPFRNSYGTGQGLLDIDLEEQLELGEGGSVLRNRMSRVDAQIARTSGFDDSFVTSTPRILAKLKEKWRAGLHNS